MAYGLAGEKSTRVLFLCTGNSARSQMAEALLQHLSHGRVDASSAGSHPKQLHPQAVRVMRKRGIDLRGRRARHVQEFATQRFDYVITLCDRVREVCPEFPGNPRTIHWSMADPALEGPAAFERTAVQLDMRMGFLLHVIRRRQGGFQPHVSSTTSTRRRADRFMDAQNARIEAG